MDRGEVRETRRDWARGRPWEAWESGYLPTAVEVQHCRIWTTEALLKPGKLKLRERKGPTDKEWGGEWSLVACSLVLFTVLYVLPPYIVVASG